MTDPTADDIERAIAKLEEGTQVAWFSSPQNIVIAAARRELARLRAPAAGTPREAIAVLSEYMAALGAKPACDVGRAVERDALVALDTLERELAENAREITALSEMRWRERREHDATRARLLEAQAQLAARPALEWIRGGEGTEHGGRELVVFDVEGRQNVTCARWDGDRDCWLDDETDGQNDRLEWYPGQVRWHIPTSALLDALAARPALDIDWCRSRVLAAIGDGLLPKLGKGAIAKVVRLMIDAAESVGGMYPYPPAPKPPEGRSDG